MSPGGAREAATPARRRVLGLASVAAPMVVLDALVVSTALTAVRVHTPPDLTLAALRREFPGYRLWLESVRGRYRFMARRRNPGTGPHTVITSDLAELRAALTTPTQVTLDHGLLREARERGTGLWSCSSRPTSPRSPTSTPSGGSTHEALRCGRSPGRSG